MKLIKAISEPVFNGNNIIYSSLNSSIRKSASFRLKYDTLQVISYGFESLTGSVMHGNQRLLVYELQNVTDTDINKIRNEQYCFKTEDGCEIILPEILSAYLIYNVTYGIDYSSQYIFILPNFEEYEESKAHCSLISYDAEKNIHNSIPFELASFSNLDGAFIAVGTKNKSRVVVKYNFNLEEEWRFVVNGQYPSSVLGQRPISNGESLIINLCTQRQRRRPVDGEIFCLSKSDGKEVWKRKFPLPVQDCQRLNTEQIVIYTETSLHVLCAETGEILQTIATPFEVAPASVQLFVYGTLLFALNKNQSLIQIYDTTSFECIREIDASEHGWLLNQRLKVFDNKIYLSVSDKRLYSSLLIIDPEDIQAPLDIEPDPSFVFTEPSEDHGSVIIEIENITIDDLIRFGEATVLEQIRNHGKNFFNSSPNKFFNGHALLKIKGLIHDDMARVKSLLDMMVERVNFFAEKDGFRCGRGKKQGYVTYQID